MAALRSILVPADGSPPSLSALAHAVALAEESDARIDVVHVEVSTLLSPENRDEDEAALDAAIEQARAELGERVSHRTLSGDPLRTIIEVASSGDYDLVVVGTHGRIGRLHALLGSVAEGVVRNAPCPVLTVREPGAGYQSFAERRHGRPSLAEQQSTSPTS